MGEVRWQGNPTAFQVKLAPGCSVVKAGKCNWVESSGTGTPRLLTLIWGGNAVTGSPALQVPSPSRSMQICGGEIPDGEMSTWYEVSFWVARMRAS